MLHDKKNTADVVNFTQLGEVGKIILDQTAESQLINEAFDFLREA
jgi:3-dehydroquinate synthase